MISIEQLEADWKKATVNFKREVYLNGLKIIREQSSKIKYPNASLSDTLSFQRYHDNASMTRKWKKDPETRPPADMNRLIIVRTKKGSGATSGWLISAFNEKQQLTAFIRASGHVVLRRRSQTNAFARPSINERQWSTLSSAALAAFILALNRSDLFKGAI